MDVVGGVCVCLGVCLVYKERKRGAGKTCRGDGDEGLQERTTQGREVSNEGRPEIQGPRRVGMCKVFGLEVEVHGPRSRRRR